MTQEEKARAYDEAIKKAAALYKASEPMSGCNVIIETLFPELAESEDEKIRKAIIEGLKEMKSNFHTISSIKINDAIAWLERQSERKTPRWMIDFLDNYRRKIGCSLDHDEARDVEGKILCIMQWLEKQGDKDKPTYSTYSKDVQLTQEEYDKRRVSDEAIIKEVEAYKKGLKDAQKIFENQGEQSADNQFTPEQASILDKHIDKFLEQKPADKVEPKFHEGDWVVYKNDICQIVKREEGCNKLVTVFGIEKELVNERNLSTAHLWTIQDAKDGDVLFQDLMCGKTFIYNGTSPNMEILYSFIISNDGKDVLPYHIGKPNTGIGNIEENKNIIHPATKKQCDLLFQKMHEAGYEWDAEKKVFKPLY